MTTEILNLGLKKDNTQQISKIYNQIHGVSIGDNNSFKNTPIYELLECRRLIAKLLIKDGFTKEGEEIFYFYNKAIKQYFIID